MDNPKSGYEVIHPKDAEKILEDNAFNRPFKMRHMLGLARQMSQGLWRTTCEPIIIDKNGRLQDGQHRLKSIIHAGIPQTLFVVRGAEPEAFVVMDTGAKRSHNDALYIAGFTETTMYGALADRMLRWDRMIFFGSVNAGLAPSNEEVVDYCKENKAEMAKTINFYNGIRSKVRGLVGRGTYIFCFHLCKVQSETQAEDFYSKLVTNLGVEHTKYQPLTLLRHRLIVNKRDDAKLSTRLITLMVLAAWNAYRKNKRLNGLPGPVDIKTARGKKFEIF